MTKQQNKLTLISLFLAGLTLTMAQNTFTDPKTQTVKTCHFSCAKCTDSSDLCVECQPNMNFQIKESNKVRCFASCPRGYQPASGDSTSTQVTLCQPDAQQEYRNQEDLNKKLKNMCSLSQYWDGTQCQNCSSNCMACSNSTSCEECVNGFFWNSTVSLCQQCHSSCSSCKGPAHTDCSSCSSLSSFYPDANGVCDKSAQKIDITVKYTKKQDLMSNLKDCSSFLKTTPTSYTVSFKNLYTQNDAKWATAELVDQNQCQIPSFSQKYSALSSQIAKCNYSQISKPTMSSKGSLITLYSIILSQHLAQLNNGLVNPQSLSAYINQNQLQSILYLKKARQDFTCDQLSCESQVNSSIPFIPTSNKTKVSLKLSKEITLTQSGKSLNCFDSASGNIDDSKLNEVEIAMAQASFSQKSSNVKLYAIADICGRTLDKTSRVQQQSLLITNYFGNGFFSAIRTDISGAVQVQNLYLQGADKAQNANLKGCNTAFTNQYESFQITKIKFIEVQEVADNFDKDANRYNQYAARGNSKLVPSSSIQKCNGVELGNLIISNDNPYNFLINQINAQNKILTTSIDFNDIKGYLKTLSIDENNLKSSKIVLSVSQSEQLFNMYLKDLTVLANNCFSSLPKAAQNIQSVLIDFLLSNNKQCTLQTEINSSIDKNDVSSLITKLQTHTWCTQQQSRCQKSIQVLKGCI